MSAFVQMWLVTVATDVPWYVLCCVAFLPFLRVRRGVMAAMVAVTGALHGLALALIVVGVPRWGNLYSAYYILYYIVLFAEFILMFRVPVSKLLYVFLLTQACSTMLYQAATPISQWLFPQVEYNMYSLAYNGVILVMMAATVPLLWRFFAGRLRAALLELPNRSFRMLCVTPVLFLVTSMLYVNLYHNIIVPEVQAQSVLILLLILLTGLVTYYLNLRMVMEASRRARMESDMAYMEKQLSLQAQSYAQLSEGIERAKTARHDLRHHLSVLAALEEKGDHEGLREYLAQYRAALPEEAAQPICENYAVDAIVRHYLAKARQAGADVDVKISLPRQAGVSDADLCVIFGNLFENAANALAAQREGRKFLTARCDTHDGRITLTVDNSTGPPGEKKDSGVGQASVRMAAGKNGGTARFTQGEGIYQCSVLLLDGSVAA